MKTFIAAAALIFAATANAGFNPGPLSAVETQVEDSNDTSRVEDNQVIVAGLIFGPLASNSQMPGERYREMVAGLPVAFRG